MVRKQFQSLNNIEREILNTDLKNFSISVENIINSTNFKFTIHFPINNQKEAYPEIFLVPNDLNYLLESLTKTKIPNSAGIYFGFIKKGKFLLSLEGLELLNDQNLLSKDHYLIIDKKGEQAILYGNDIRKNMVKSYPLTFKTDHLVAVLNVHKELLCIAKPIINFNEWNLFQRKKRIAINLIDKGYYLRSAQ